MKLSRLTSCIHHPRLAQHHHHHTPRAGVKIRFNDSILIPQQPKGINNMPSFFHLFWQGWLSFRFILEATIYYYVYLYLNIIMWIWRWIEPMKLGSFHIWLTTRCEPPINVNFNVASERMRGFQTFQIIAQVTDCHSRVDINANAKQFRLWNRCIHNANAQCACCANTFWTQLNWNGLRMA